MQITTQYNMDNAFLKFRTNLKSFLIMHFCLRGGFYSIENIERQDHKRFIADFFQRIRIKA